eukprot:Nitzschia sp. Nitz4//scaffold313_size41840//30230//31573//NITZ4_007438-RA/size41840-processed-gene-0.13-mRNA-1//-1//CDS//3329547436//1922//frame0
MATVVQDWSPFSCLPRATLTASGLLQLDVADHEVELVRRGPIELRHDGLEPMAPCPSHVNSGVWKARTSNLTVTVTTHRLVLFCSPSSSSSSGSSIPEARFLHLSNLHQIQPSGGPSFLHPNASHKLTLSTYTYGDLILAFSASSAANRDAVQPQLEKALERRAWEMATRWKEQQTATQQHQHQMTKRRVGVDHIMTKNKLKHQRAQQLADEALGGDAERLLQEAGALLQVIQQYTTMLQKEQQSQQSGEDDADAQRLSVLLQDMGMTSALTKDQVLSAKSNRRRGGRGSGGNHPSAHEEYYELLARQLADFLLPKLPSMGGILSLTDVYCLFNRARGTNLVSPEDLRQACDVLTDLRLGISPRTFPSSGVVVIQLDAQFDAPHQRLLDLCPTTALEASHVLKLSPLLALEQLEEAERQGWLCRDVTLETVRFYPNSFDKWIDTTTQ